MGSRCCLSLPVLVVLVLYGFVYYTTVWLVIEPWLGFGTVNGLLNLVFLTLVALMGLLSYACAILRDPGAVPPGWIPDSEDGDEAIQEVKRKGGEVRYCQKCSHYKPARAHHCRVCKRCVLRMDHHCVWINNCVGYHNYKSFFLFVLYVVTACIHSLVLMFGQMMDSIAESNDEEGNEAWQRSESASTSTAISTLFRVMCTTIEIPLVLALGVLLGWHIYLLSCNKTTIEHHEGVRARWLAHRAGESYQHPYDLGIVNNSITVLGPHASCWVCPTAVGHLGSGLRFPTSSDVLADGAFPDGASGKDTGGLWLTRKTRLPC